MRKAVLAFAAAALLTSPALAGPKALSEAEMDATTAAGSNTNWTHQHNIAVSKAIALCVQCSGDAYVEANSDIYQVNTNVTVQDADGDTSNYNHTQQLNVGISRSVAICVQCTGDAGATASSTIGSYNGNETYQN